MDKSMLTALVNRKEKGKQKMKKKRSLSPTTQVKPTKKVKLSSTPGPKATKRPHKEEKKTSPPVKDDSIYNLPEPEPAIRITEVNLANAPNTKRDHDYRPVMFAGCMDMEGRKHVEEELSEWVKPLTEPPDHITSHVIVPTKAKWFCRGSIHQIEKSSLPEFFNDTNKSKTPETYTAYRNYILDTYMAKPQKYLTMVECRRRLPGDLCSIFRVHTFLEYWGLINFGLNILNNHKPSKLLLPHTDAHFFTLTDTHTGTHPSEPLRRSHKTSTAEHCIDFNSDDDFEGDTTPSIQAPTESEECTNTPESMNLGMSPIDIELDRSHSVMIDYREWTDQEVLRLMQGIEQYKDDWNKVGEHVGSRNQDECLLYFMRLPVEEKFTDKGSTLSHADDVIPFARSCNPVMYTMAFLANVVNAKVAASAAKAALEVFSFLKDSSDTTTPDKIVERHIRNIKAAMDGEAAPSTEQRKLKEPDDEWTKYSYTDRRVIKIALDKALEAAAKKALELAQQDELKIKAGVALLVNKQTKKLSVKMNFLESISAKLDNDIRQIERERQVLLSKRQAYHQIVLDRFNLEARHTAVIPEEIEDLDDKNLMESSQAPYSGDQDLYKSSSSFRKGKRTDYENSIPSRLVGKADPFGFDDSLSPHKKFTPKLSPNLACDIDKKAKTEDSISITKQEVKLEVVSSDSLEETTPSNQTNPLDDANIDNCSEFKEDVVPEINTNNEMEGDSELVTEQDDALSDIPATIEPYFESINYHTYEDDIGAATSYLDEDTSALTTPLTDSMEIDMTSEDNQAAALLDFS